MSVKKRARHSGNRSASSKAWLSTSAGVSTSTISARIASISREMTDADGAFSSPKATLASHPMSLSE